ncbi:MAG: hypothetical protein ACTSRI_01385 [Promethearchaeota archaeon]
MEKNNKRFPKIEFKIESELFALVNTIINLENKYQEGVISDIFFQKSIKSALNGLLKINIYFKEKNILLTDFVKKKNFFTKYNNAVSIINDISPLNSSKEITKSINGNKFKNKPRMSVLELPGITSEITSSFITLMDALKLEGLRGDDIVAKLFKELKKNLDKFPGLKDIKIRIKKINEQILNNANILVNSKEILVDELYQVFKEFQNKINLKT